MILYVVAVRDRSADAFGQPNFVTALGSAIRSFGDEINNPREGNVLNAHPEDFDLYELGSYDDNLGSFQLLDRPRQIAVGKDAVRS